jgi:uncharacterized membrane protein HdeD (DUF308 family)
MSVDAEHPSVAFPLKGARGWLIFEGLLMVALGVLAGALPVFAGLAVALVMGWVLVFSGLLSLVGLFGSRGHDHPVWRVVSALIAIGAGGIVLWSPVVGVMGLAILIAAYLTLNAITAFAMAVHHRGRAARGWGWLVFSGLVGIALAVFILLLNPRGDAVLIGFFIAINLIVGGLSLFGISAGIRRATPHAASA